MKTTSMHCAAQNYPECAGAWDQAPAQYFLDYIVLMDREVIKDHIHFKLRLADKES